MGGIRFDHVALGMARMADAPAVLMGDLGGVPAVGGTAADFRWGAWRFDGGGMIEVIEPRGENGFLHRFLGKAGPGIHHVTFVVPSLRETCDRAEAHGYRIVDYDDADPRWATAFLRPRQALGLVVQLAQSSGDKGLPAWQAPPGPPDPPPPVTILGLRTRARSGERARVQWERILEGTVAEGPAGELVFRWPGSPMSLAVEVDPVAEEGSLSIELASERIVPLPAGRHPILGAVLVQQQTATGGREHDGQGHQV